MRRAGTPAALGTSAIAPLRQHATPVYLIESAGIVARLSRTHAERQAASTAVALTQWLIGQNFPATAPAALEQPVHIADHTVTFWHYYPQDAPTAPSAKHLGSLLRELHQLPTPPIELEPYPPLRTLGQALESTTTLPQADRNWLLQRRRELITAYNHLDSQLGHGFIHGDAYPGNTLWNGNQVLLGDWDEAAIGPRELDLVNTHQGARFGRTKEELQAFTEAYGHDVTTWPGFPVLREMRDLHTLASYIRLADNSHHAAYHELTHRVRTLRENDTTARWNAG